MSTTNKNNALVTHEPTGNDNMTSLVTYQGRATTAVQDIMKCVVADNSMQKYTNENITLILWIYNNDSLRKYLLHDWIVDKLHITVAEDGTKKSRPVARHVLKTVLNAVQKGQDNCPITLGKVTFNLFLHYIMT
eukprot:12779614-Ditylum_brightwellii.AAC.1